MEFEESGRPNKSALKRAAREVEIVAEQLAGETEDALKALALPVTLRDEFDLVRRAKGHGARKRQVKHLAGYLRHHEEEFSAVQASLLGRSEHHWAEQRDFHKVEAWRDRLCDPHQAEAAVAELRQRCPELDLKELAKLSRTACNGDKAAARQVFRRLREVGDRLS
jgi:ribosome-associated protein